MSSSFHHANNRASIEWMTAQMKQDRPNTKSSFTPKSRKSMYGRAPGTSILFQDKITKIQRSSLFGGCYLTEEDPTMSTDKIMSTTCTSIKQSKQHLGNLSVPKRILQQSHIVNIKSHLQNHQVKLKSAAQRRQLKNRIQKQKVNFRFKIYENQLLAFKDAQKMLQKQNILRENALQIDLSNRRQKVEQDRKNYSQKIRMQTANRLNQSRIKLAEIRSAQQSLNRTVQQQEKYIHLTEISPQEPTKEQKEKFQELMNFGLKKYLLPILAKNKIQKIQKQEEIAFKRKLQTIPDHQLIGRQIRSLYKVKDQQSQTKRQIKENENIQNNPYNKIIYLSVQKEVKDPLRLLKTLKNRLKNNMKNKNLQNILKSLTL